MVVDYIYNIESNLYDVLVMDNDRTFVIDVVCSCKDFMNADFIVSVLENHVFIDT